MEAVPLSSNMYLDFIKSKPVAVIHFWATELKVLNLPALVYYKNGEHIETTICLGTKEQIESKIEGPLNNSVKRNPFSFYRP